MIDKNQPIRIMIGTMCGGGQITLQYFLSFMQTYRGCMERARQGKRPIDLGLYTLAQESLISRGRDHIAAQALYQKVDKLMFIDADQGWTFEQFEKLVDSDKMIIGAVSPIKTLPIALNYLPLESDEFYHKGAIRSYESLLAMRQGHKTAEIEVGYVGTGVLAIDCRVFMKLAEFAEPFRYPNPATGRLATHWQFFTTRPINKQCKSEDWGFESFAREHGFKIHINADCIVSHTGNYTFDARMSTDPKLLEQHAEFMKSCQQREVKV